MNSRIILVASLFIHPGQEVAFRRFETEAVHVMKKYGGRIDHVIRPNTSVPSGSSAHEVHVVSFPSMEQFEAYRGDAELAKLALLRQSAIARTEIIIGEEGEPYL